MKLTASDVDSRVVVLGKGIPCRSYTEVQSRRTTIQGSQSTFPCKPKICRNRMGKAIINGIEVWRKSSKSAVK